MIQLGNTPTKVFSFVRNNPINSFGPDERLKISVEKEATVTMCGGWEQGKWSYLMGAQYSHEVYRVQKVTLEEQLHLDCKSARNPTCHKYEFLGKHTNLPPH
jgi:hypothetical protein